MQTIKSRFIWFAAVAAVTVGFLAMPAGVLNTAYGQGTPTPGSDASPAPSATGAVPMTDAQIQKILQVAAQQGTDVTLSSAVTKALGLTDGDFRQLAVLQQTAQVKHAFQRVPSDGGYILIVGTDDSNDNYRTNAHQELVAAVNLRGNGMATAIPTEEAKNGLKTELIFWGKLADKL